MKIMPVITFVAGAAVGSFATWRILKKKYDAILQEEIESIKDAYGRKTPEKEQSDEPKETVKKKDDMTMQEYAKVIAEARYTNHVTMPLASPYVISPDQYSEFSDYMAVSLVYYEADGVLADDDGTVYDISDTIGVESLEHFGEYEEECVHVRNDDARADYEVLLDYRKYSEVFSDRDN